MSCGIDEALLPLTGEWRFESSSGGHVSGSAQVIGNNRIIIEGDDLIWKVDGATLFTGKLCYEKEKYYDRIILYKKSTLEPNEFASSLSAGMGFQVVEDSLTLWDICNDCYSYLFIRI